MKSNDSYFPAWESVSREAAEGVPVIDEVDILVVGGGASGVAAATVAAEAEHRKTMLIERYDFCGGAAVAGMSGTMGEIFKDVLSKSSAGRSRVFARRIIDGSGDAAVVARAGGRYRFGTPERFRTRRCFFRLER